jgi:hypothetical protein
MEEKISFCLLIFIQYQHTRMYVSIHKHVTHTLMCMGIYHLRRALEASVKKFIIQQRLLVRSKKENVKILVNTQSNIFMNMLHS